MKRIKTFLGILKYNFLTLVIFSLMYTISAWVIMLSLGNLLFDGAVRLSGLGYIGQNNIIQFMTAPSTWIYFILKGILILAAILYELSGMIILFDCSYRKIKIGFFQLTKETFLAVKKMCVVSNMFVAVDLLLFVPFMGLSSITNMSSDLRIPGFIMDYVQHHTMLNIALMIFELILYVFLIRRMFTFHGMIIHGQRYKEAADSSVSLVKGKFFRTIITLFASVLVLALAILLGFILLSLGISAIFAKIGFTFEKCIYYSILTLLVVFIYFYPFILIAQISTMYYMRTEDQREDVNGISETVVSKRLKISTMVVIAGCIIAFLASFVVDGLSADISLSRPVIGAHRGSSVDAPENTMPAFELAIEEGVSDWIELDVHQTLDGKVIVSHDDNIKRVSGVNVCVHEMNYEDLMKLDVGSWFSPKFKDLHFSTLDEVLDVCKGKINIQIEIKPTKYDRALPEQVADIIKSHGMEEECLVISLSDKPLRTIKSYAPEIKTGYCMMIADGNLTKMDFSDDVTIEEGNATESLIRKMHKEGKKVFVWTVNNTDTLQKLVDMGVDGIVTDNPLLIHKALEEEIDYLGGFAKILRRYMQ